MAETLEGGCFCGAVTYEADGLSSPIGYCHCETCRKTHSAPFIATARTPYEGFHWTKGEDIVASIESSPGKHRYFCPRCGSHMMAELPEEKRRILRVCSVTSPLPSKPVVHIWTSEKSELFDFNDGLPQLPKGAPKPS